MLEILNAPTQVIRKNLKTLAKDYKEKTGRVVCLSCPSDVQYMIASLKNIYKMTNFAFKKEAAQYKNKKGDKITISNNTMTDEAAIEFLKTNPERIRLFSKFPENWEELIKGDGQVDLIDSIEEQEKINELNVEGVEDVSSGEEDCCDDEHEGEPCEECKEKKRAELMAMKVPELKAAYPEVKYEFGMKKAEFVELVLNQ